MEDIKDCQVRILYSGQINLRLSNGAACKGTVTFNTDFILPMGGGGQQMDSGQKL